MLCYFVWFISCNKYDMTTFALTFATVLIAKGIGLQQCQFSVKIWAASWENQQCGFRTGLTQTDLCKHSRQLKAWNFGFKKKRNCTFRVAKTKALISFVVTAKLICIFVFAYADCWFSHVVAHMSSLRGMKSNFIGHMIKQNLHLWSLHMILFSYDCQRLVK